MPVPKGSTLDPERTRATIIETVMPILYERGLDGVGVAELCAVTGVSKETLYRHFGSKEGLIEAVLEARSERVTRWLRTAAESAGEEPADQLAAVFDALLEWHGEPGFRGCALLNAAAQHHDAPELDLVGRHLERRLALLTEIATRAGAGDPGALARQWLVLVTGCTVVADQHPGTRDAARLAREAALALLTAARAGA
ncbi:TetR/AcrR family transcriptional regulator [Nonomuraea gerenzanensis]|uniref:Transcriptional regulator, TetR family n=1 Tax=Nonomuraea gerenzanensis TaxID=93944 RepID=A0A1M4E4K5_9ACTN|nr:TetR/AcrR family transcriptional regulator [Nonomuraea gerenzanensis]UBU15913.1 TetR/AcrR family transcriptional regulator [Nonomuraea gerenzanensis]SBO93710.1 Transcriptional regulator, TetR family [Nonomuraea gerenzanensis]